jgi:hypothetical protein
MNKYIFYRKKTNFKNGLQIVEFFFFSRVSNIMCGWVILFAQGRGHDGGWWDTCTSQVRQR